LLEAGVSGVLFSFKNFIAPRIVRWCQKMYVPKLPRNDNPIASVLQRNIEVFRKTGLNDLASKWERILKTYMTPKTLSDSTPTVTPNGFAREGCPNPIQNQYKFH